MRINATMLNEIINDIEQYIPKLIRAGDSTSELLYEPLTEASAQVFSQYLQGLVDFTQTMIITLEDAQEHTHFIYSHASPIFHAILIQIENLEKALIDNRYVDVADIIKYEITKMLSSLLLVMKESHIV